MLAENSSYSQYSMCYIMYSLIHSQITSFITCIHWYRTIGFNWQNSLLGEGNFAHTPQILKTQGNNHNNHNVWMNAMASESTP